MCITHREHVWPANQPTLKIVALCQKRLGTPALVRRSWRSRFDSLQWQIFLRPSVPTLFMIHRASYHVAAGVKSYRCPLTSTSIAAKESDRMDDRNDISQGCKLVTHRYLPVHPPCALFQTLVFSRVCHVIINTNISVKRTSTGLEGSKGKLHRRGNRNFSKDMRRRGRLI